MKRTHGHSHSNNGKPSPTYHSWLAMRKRCLQTGHNSYPRYGGRGVTICDRWSRFENFLADMGPRPKGTTLDRKDNNGNYTPDNCRWATKQEQNSNKRNSVTFGVLCQRESAKPAHTERKGAHGHARTGERTPEYYAWQNIMRCCYNPDYKDYPRIGGKGITVDPLWHTFVGFLIGVGKRPSRRHQLHRINLSENYCPDNVRWLTPRQAATARAAFQLPALARQAMIHRLSVDSL